MTVPFVLFRTTLSIAILTAVGSLWLLAATFSPLNSPSGILPEHASECSLCNWKPCSGELIRSQKVVLNDAPRNQVVVRTTSTNLAGIGSVVAQLRSSAAIATMLGAKFTTYPVTSEQPSQYRVASLLHLDHLETPLEADARVCSLSMSPSYDRTLELVESWCDNATLADAHALELRGLFSDCGLILDDRPWDVRYDMSKCTWKWVKDIFSNLGRKNRRRGIGLHIRWGDMSISTPWNDPLRPERSTPIEMGAQLLRKIRECGVQDELSVYMELHNDTILSGLGEPYHIVDTGDPIDDLIDLATNRLMILDISSWTVLAHQIAEGGVTIIPDIDLFSITWHDNGVNHVLRWHEFLSIPCSEFSILYDA
jgi:hypothetical protein